MDGEHDRNNGAQKYLGVKLDRSLTHKPHNIEDVKNKVKTRINIISKVAGTALGRLASVLKTSTLDLVNSVGEYCAPVWARSTHSQNIDI